MTVEEVRKYAKEKGLSAKKIDLLVAELHPDENSRLSIEEYAQAIFAIDYHLATKKYIELCLKQTKAIRDRRSKNEAK